MPWIVGEHGVPIDLTPTQPMIVMEKSSVHLFPEWHKYWIRVMDMAAIDGADKAMQMIRDTYVNQIIYLESAKSLLERIDIVHATWTALLMWHKTGKISGLSIGHIPLDMSSIEHKDPPPFRPGIMFDIICSTFY